MVGFISAQPLPSDLLLGLPPVFVIVLVVVGAGTRGMVVEAASGLSTDIVAPVRLGGGLKALAQELCHPASMENKQSLKRSANCWRVTPVSLRRQA